MIGESKSGALLDPVDAASIGIRCICIPAALLIYEELLRAIDGRRQSHAVLLNDRKTYPRVVVVVLVAAALRNHIRVIRGRAGDAIPVVRETLETILYGRDVARSARQIRWHAGQR